LNKQENLRKIDNFQNVFIKLGIMVILALCLMAGIVFLINNYALLAIPNITSFNHFELLHLSKLPLDYAAIYAAFFLVIFLNCFRLLLIAGKFYILKDFFASVTSLILFLVLSLEILYHLL